VSFQHGTESYALSVTDDGPGLPKDFTPLASGSLGMALVWSLCEQLGASLDWKTGEGTTFTVNVPIPDTEVQESSPGA
jgi:two-component sensor histidine kinase